MTMERPLLMAGSRSDGPGGLIERWTARSEGRRIRWSSVRWIDDRVIIVGEPKQPRN